MLGFMFAGYRSGMHSRSGPSSSEVRSIAERPAKELSRRVDGLELACVGLWELLKSKHGYTDEDLVTMIREVDLRDGKLDGRIRKTATNCASCGRQLLTRRSPNCHWCGAEISKGPF